MDYNVAILFFGGVGGTYALVEWVKKFGVHGQVLLVISMLMAIALQVVLFYAGYGAPDLTQAIAFGGFVGLGTSGVHDIRNGSPRLVPIDVEEVEVE